MGSYGHRVKATWKVEYMYSTHKNARVVHLIDKERSYVHYFRTTKFQKARFRFRVFTKCRNGVVEKYAKLSNTIPEGRQICRQCQLEAAGVGWFARGGGFR